MAYKNLIKHSRPMHKYAKCEACMFRNWWNAKRFMVYSGKVHTYAWRNREGHHVRRLTSLKRMVKRRLKNMRQWSNRLVSSYKKMGRIEEYKETKPKPLNSEEVSKQIKEQVELLKSGRKVFLHMDESDLASSKLAAERTPTKSCAQDKKLTGSNCTSAEKPEESWRAGGGKFLDTLIRKLGVETIAHKAIISSETSPAALPVTSKDFVGYVQQPGKMLTPLVPENCRTLDKNSAFVSDSLDAYMREHYASEPQLDPSLQEEKERLLNQTLEEPEKVKELQEQEERSLNFGFTKPEVGKHTDRMVAKTKTKQQRRLIYELTRLNATIVDTASLSAHAHIPCSKDFCRLGCVCSSLAGTVPLRSHCGKAECVLECHCQGADQAGVMLVEADTGHGITSKEAFHLRQRATERLAKMEREFTSTLVLLDNEVVLVNESQAAKKRRCTMAPKRYKDFEDIDLFMEEEEDEVPRSSHRRRCKMTPKRYKESDDIDNIEEDEYEVPRSSKRQKKMAAATAASARIPSPVPNERCTVGNPELDQLKHCQVGLRRLRDIGNFCMSHQVAHRPPGVADSNSDQATRADDSFQRQSKRLSAKKKGKDKQHKTQAEHKPKNASESENTRPEMVETNTEGIPKEAVELSGSPKESSIDLDTISIYFSSRPHMCRRAVSVPKNSYQRLNHSRVERVLQNTARLETSETEKLLQRYVMDDNTNYRREIDIQREKERGNNKTPERESLSLLVERNAAKPTERQETSGPLRFQVEEQVTLESIELVPQEPLEPKELLQRAITDDISDYREEFDIQQERERGSNKTPERDDSEESEVHSLLLKGSPAKPAEHQNRRKPMEHEEEKQDSLESEGLVQQAASETKELLQSGITDDLTDYREEIHMQQERDQGSNSSVLQFQAEEQEPLEVQALVQQESSEANELLQREDIEGQRKQENGNNVPVIEKRDDSNETLGLLRKRSLAKPSEDQISSKHLKLQEEEQSDVQVPTIAACYTLNPASADVLVDRSVEVPSESALANDPTYNKVVKDTETRSKFIPAPKKGTTCFINWKNFRDAFESHYIFLWTVQMQTHTFLAATTANQTPSVSDAIRVVNTRFIRDQGGLPPMAVQLMENLQNVTSNRLIAMEGRQGYWLIRSIEGSIERHSSTKNNNIVDNRLIQQGQSEVQQEGLQTAVEGGSSEPEPQAQGDIPATASSSTQDLLTNIEFRPLRQDDVDELQIPEQHSNDHHWMVLDFYDDFSHIFVPDCGDMISVPRIHTFMQMARESGKVVKLQFFPRSPYDAFVTPSCEKKIYFGPLPLDMPLPLILLIQMVDGKLMTREVYQKEYSVPVQRHRRSMAFRVLHVNGRVSYERDSDSAAKLEEQIAREEDELAPLSLEEPFQSQANHLDTDKQLEDSLSVSDIKEKLSRMNFTLTEANDSPPSLTEDVTPCPPEVPAEDAEPATNSLQSLTQLTHSLPTLLSNTSSSLAALRLPAKDSRLSMPLAKINDSLQELLSSGNTVTPGEITITKLDDQKGVQNEPSVSESPAPNAFPAPVIPKVYLGRKPLLPKLEVKTPNGVKAFPVSLIFLLKNPTMPFSKVREPQQPPLGGLEINPRPNTPAQSQTMPGNANEKVRTEPPSQSLPSSEALSAPLKISDQPAPAVRPDQAAASCPKPPASVANEAVETDSSKRAVSGIAEQTVQNAFHPAPTLTAGSGASPMTIPPFQPPPFRAAVSAGWPSEVVKIYPRPNMPVNRQSMPGNANRIVRAPPPRPSVATEPIAATPVSTTKLPVAGEASSHLAMPIRAPAPAGQQTRHQQSRSGYIHARGLPLYPTRVLGSDFIVKLSGIERLRFKSLSDTGCFLNRHLSRIPPFKSRVPADWEFLPLKQQDPSSTGIED